MRYALLLLMVISLIFINCSDEKEMTDIIIHHKLLDDVSPVVAVFTTNVEVTWDEWKVDSIRIAPNERNRLEYTFDKLESSSIVKYEARGIDGEFYFGELTIDVPSVANSIIIDGYYFEEDNEFNIEHDSLNLLVRYFDGENNTYFNNLISKVDFDNADSFRFETPVVIGFNKPVSEFNDNEFISFSIIGYDSNTEYFRQSSFVKSWYYHDRLYAPNYIYLDNHLGENKERIFLNVDWTN